MSKDKSFSERVAALFSRKTEGPSTQDELKKLGITTLADQKFAERQQLLNELLVRLTEKIEKKTPIAQAEALEKLLNDVHIAIHMLAAPYYQTLDNVNYYRLMRGWSAWHALSKLWLSTVKDRIKSVETTTTTTEEGTEEHNENKPNWNPDYTLFPPITQTKGTIIDIATLVSRVSSVLYFHVFQDAHLILLQSYSAEDVREKWAVVVNQPFQYGPKVPTKAAPEGYEMMLARMAEMQRELERLKKG